MAKKPARRVSTESQSENTNEAGSENVASEAGVDQFRRDREEIAWMLGARLAEDNVSADNSIPSSIEKIEKSLRSITPDQFEKTPEFAEIRHHTHRISRAVRKIGDIIPSLLDYVRATEPTKAKEGPDDGTSRVNQDKLDNANDTIQWHLDAIAEHIRKNPSAAPDVCMHDFFGEAAKLSGLEIEIDYVALEIAREVTISWEDRTLPVYKTEPWTRNASTFIEQVYRKWLEAGTLKLKHLRREPKLYDSYITLIKRDSDWDLGLETNSYTNSTTPRTSLKS